MSMSSHGTENRENRSRRSWKMLKLADMWAPCYSPFLIMFETFYEKKKRKREAVQVQRRLSPPPPPPIPSPLTPPSLPSSPSWPPWSPSPSSWDVVRLGVRQVPPKAPRRRDQQRWGQVPGQRTSSRLSARDHMQKDHLAAELRRKSGSTARAQKLKVISPLTSQWPRYGVSIRNYGSLEEETDPPITKQHLESCVLPAKDSLKWEGMIRDIMGALYLAGFSLHQSQQSSIPKSGDQALNSAITE